MLTLLELEIDECVAVHHSEDHNSEDDRGFPLAQNQAGILRDFGLGTLLANSGDLRASS